MRALTLLLAAMMGIMLIGVSGAPEAEASVSCYDSECVGLNPAGTTCGNDATTIGAMDAHGGMLELRWSPTCNSAWGRYSYTDITGLGELTAERTLGALQKRSRPTPW